MTQVWVVWEANAIVPKVFTTLKAAEAYRTERDKRIQHRHRIYTAPADLEGDDANETTA